jgi:two-component system, NtrC family, nitrogen regulation sensor histidine kinase NtrY
MSLNCCNDATMAEFGAAKLPRLRRYVAVAVRRRQWIPIIEAIALGSAIAIGGATWAWLAQNSGSEQVLSPFVVVSVLMANLAPAILLIVLLGRREAKRRAAQSLVGANGQLHVRLVALFSTVATVPMVLMVIITSLLFQYSVDIWYSGRARQMFENTTALAQQYYGEKQQRVMDETRAMAGDLSAALQSESIESPGFANQFAYQVYQRELSEGAVLALTAQNGLQSLAIVNPYERPADNWVSRDVIQKLIKTKDTVFQDTGERMEAIAPMPGSTKLFLYASRVAQKNTIDQARRAGLVQKDYFSLLKRSPKLQMRINLALYVVSLLVIGLAVLMALAVADRLVRPVGELVDAARKVAAGDLGVRVTALKTRDEVGVLSRAFNRMTARLGEQNSALVASNELLDRRRALIEAVMSGVTAGVIALGPTGIIRLINSSASTLLRADPDAVTGEPLSSISPELAEMLENRKSEAIVQLIRDTEARTLAVKIVRDEAGHVVTFDDITEQLADQRRAAWSDVARRVAHEIKNPLTPIQLAAERLNRRFGKNLGEDTPAFEKLTDTIIRQVADLRRMVDEFSSFARMPKPIFESESIVDIAREAMFLHEVANQGIKFIVEAPSPAPQLVCDRRQLAQALSNIVKNGVEAITQKDDHDGTDEVRMQIATTSCGTIELRVSDTGIGLPVERERIVEPYMTTREGGTGLGLSIVKKIVEEHMGTIIFSDKTEGGTLVTLTFDPAMIAAFVATGSHPLDDVAEALPAKLTRTTTKTRSS